ncbi:core histone macro-H2A.1-like [Sycon ciliatum]|uniref:core histone macro-H2A.1-like n=1 Tax=Sycon ciliatum TaxID=27933 RepID=UPI0020AB1A9B|eukprot:scpid4699/ scgid31481/ Core histone macro-H2A.1; H2A.y; H2A/y
MAPARIRGPAGGKKKGASRSKSSRAGLQFPVGRINRYLRQFILKKRISAVAPVYLSAVLEYLVAEVVELAGNAARQNKKSRIIPRHILLAVANDEELHRVLKGVTIPNGGVLPQIRPELLSKVKGHKKWMDPSSQPAPVVKAPKPKPKPKAAAAAPKGRAAKAAAQVQAKGRGKSMAKAAASKAPAASGRRKSAAAASSTARNTSSIVVLSEKTLFLGQKLTVIEGDLSSLSCDAVVHPTNASMYLGGEVGTALLKAGGADFQQEVTALLANHGSLSVGDAAICSGHSLPASHVIHVHSPQWGTATSEDDLEKCVKNCLSLADTSQVKSLALPSVGSGSNRFPKETAARLIIKAIKSYFVSVMASNIKQVYFVLYDQETIDIYNAELNRIDD